MTRIGLCSLAVLLGAAWPALAMTLTSHDLADGQAFPQAQFHDRCGGQDISPQLAWRGQPKAAKSVVVTMIDQDVKPSKWSHWIVVNLPPKAQGLPRGVIGLPAPGVTVVSNMGRGLYSGPCPPHGTGVHHYQITVWALPTATITVAPAGKAIDLEAQLQQAALDHATIVGTAER